MTVEQASDLSGATQWRPAVSPLTAVKFAMQAGNVPWIGGEHDESRATVIVTMRRRTAPRRAAHDAPGPAEHRRSSVHDNARLQVAC